LAQAHYKTFHQRYPIWLINPRISWVYGGDTNADQSHRATYHSHASSTFSNSTAHDLNVGAADITGYYAKDTVSFGGLTIPKAEIGIVRPNATDPLEDTPEDGIMGMSPSHVYAMLDYIIE